jgi:hypothetical protein
MLVVATCKVGQKLDVVGVSGVKPFDVDYD